MSLKMTVLCVLACLAMAGLVITGFKGIVLLQRRDAEKAYRETCASLRSPGHDDGPHLRMDFLLGHPDGAAFLKRLDREFDTVAFDEARQAVYSFRFHGFSAATDHAACLTLSRRTGSGWVKIPDYLIPTKVEMRGGSAELDLRASEKEYRSIVESFGLTPGARYVATLSARPEGLFASVANPKMTK